MRSLGSASSVLQSLSYGDLLPLLFCEVGFLIGTAFAAYEVWLTREGRGSGASTTSSSSSVSRIRNDGAGGIQDGADIIVGRDSAATTATGGGKRVGAGGGIVPPMHGTRATSSSSSSSSSANRSIPIRGSGGGRIGVNSSSNVGVGSAIISAQGTQRAYKYGDNRGSVDTYEGSREDLESGSRVVGGKVHRGRTAGVPMPGRRSVMADGASGGIGGKGGQSSGDSTRRAFFRLLFLALLSRLLLLPVQAFFFAPSSHHIHPGTGMCMSSPACIFSRTLPDMCFASAFSLLVLFYAQLAGTASGGDPRGLSYFLTRRRLFGMCNLYCYSIYTLLFIFTAFVPHVPYALFQLLIWTMLCLIYATLLGSLSYFGPVLLKLLRPSLVRRSALAMRLSATCFVCAAVFLSRTVCFAVAVYDTGDKWSHGITENSHSDAVWLNRNLWIYALLELLPSVTILALMHQQSKRSGSSQSPSAAAGTTPPAGHLTGGGIGYGTLPRSAGQIAAFAALEGGSPGRSSPGASGIPRDRTSSPGRGSIRRSLSGSAAPSGKRNESTARAGLGIEGTPLLDSSRADRNGTKRGVTAQFDFSRYKNQATEKF